MTMILEHWKHEAVVAERHLVLPDGCEDLICSVDAVGKPTWFISDLASQAYDVDISMGDVTQGVRFAEGISIQKEALLASIHEDADMDEVKQYIGEFVRVDANVEDALAVLRQEDNVTNAAKVLGVSSRSLQRLLVKYTQKPPSFWLRLGRLRACANLMVQNDAPSVLAHIAYEMGYADQAHMTHEFKRWFGMTPQQFRQRADLVEVICARGYGT